jgi:hypothetical protein
MTKTISGAIFGSITALTLAAMPASAGYNNSNCSGVNNAHFGGFHPPIHNNNSNMTGHNNANAYGHIPKLPDLTSYYPVHNNNSNVSGHNNANGHMHEQHEMANHPKSHGARPMGHGGSIW